jgi:Tfp pilus assembly protein PilE
MKESRGYMVIMLMMAVFVITLGLLVAVPVWQTELQREKE